MILFLQYTVLVINSLPRKLHSLESGFQGGPASDQIEICMCSLTDAHLYYIVQEIENQML